MWPTAGLASALVRLVLVLTWVCGDGDGEVFGVMVGVPFSGFDEGLDASGESGDGVVHGEGKEGVRF